MAKHKVYKTNPVRKYIILSLFIFLFIGVGYSVLSTSLNVTGNVNVWKHDQTLYGVLEYEGKKGNYATKYTGLHQDSMNASLSNKDIYHWQADDSTEATMIKNKWNVIFANHCWQMYRTTDTGGVRLLYNGEVENGQCLSTRGNHVGYANKTSQSLLSTYYYGTSYTYDSSNNLFSLDGTITTGVVNIGQYTCKKSTSTGTCSTLYLVQSLSSDGELYNTIVLNSNSVYSQFGNLQFNLEYDAPSYVGYMYNTAYHFDSVFASHIDVVDHSGLNNTVMLYFGTDVTYDSNTGNYSLVNMTQDTLQNAYSNVVGSYTCYTDTECSSVFYIAAATQDGSIYGFRMRNGNTVNYYNTNITFGTDYTENNGVFTLTNITTISRTDWYSNCSTYKHYYTCGDNSNSCTDLKYIIGLDNYDSYYAVPVDHNYIYASDFSYDNNTGLYTLGSNRTQFWNFADSTNTGRLSNYHYTCLNDSGVCNTISYVFYSPASPNNSSAFMYYISFDGGRSIVDAIDEMLYNDDVNTKDSFIKTGVDAWYKKYLIGFSNYLEDTIFCNNREQSSTTHGWNPNGGSVRNYMTFNYSNLMCPRETDRFSISNSKARLIYPVGLVDDTEIDLLGYKDVYVSVANYWSITPAAVFNVFAHNRMISTNGYSSMTAVYTNHGIRPVVSLKPGTDFSSGDGSMANPYVVSTN